MQKYLRTDVSVPRQGRRPALSPPTQVPKAVNDAAATTRLHGAASLAGWRARSDVCHRPCPSIPECCALHSQAVFCTALERNKHRSDPRRAQLNSSQRQGHTVRSRPARFWPRTSTMTAREPLSTRWRKSRSPSTRSSCAKVRHRACVCAEPAGGCSRAHCTPRCYCCRCAAGDKGNNFYVIKEGTAEVTLTDASGTKHVRTLSAGNSCGELSLLTGEPRSATVQATSAESERLANGRASPRRR